MTISGEKYEYETNVLIGASQRSWAICEESIQTVYIEQNRGSHFNPVMDSMRIYFLLVRFFLSSVATSLIDFVTFLGLSQAGVSLFLSIVFARLVAALFNFNVNRSVVFKSDRKTVVLAIQYWLLVAVMSGFSFVGTRVLSQRGLNLYAAKIVVELTLFIFSFLIQRDIVFRKREAYESD
jgi:putative flippase GtrA